MIDTRKIHPTTPPEKKPIKDNSTPSCEDFIELIAKKQKQQEEVQNIPALTPWEVNIGSRLSELGEAIVMRQKIKDEWHREIYCICDFITYMKMDDIT